MCNVVTAASLDQEIFRELKQEKRRSSCTMSAFAMRWRMGNNDIGNYDTEAFRRRSIRPRRPPSLSRLIKARDFEQIREILDDPSVDVIRWIESCTDFLGQTGLHVLLKTAPPLDVVDSMLAKLESIQSSSSDKSLLQVADCTGWTPLHAAVASGCGPDVISRVLASLSREDARILAKSCDGHGRLPLHWACISESDESKAAKRMKQQRRASLKLNDNNDESGKSSKISKLRRISLRVVEVEDVEEVQRRRQEQQEVVQLLLAVYPGAVSVFDHWGYTPADYLAKSVGLNTSEEGQAVLNAMIQNLPQSTGTPSEDVLSIDADVDDGQANYPSIIEFVALNGSDDDDNVSVVTLPSGLES